MKLNSSEIGSSSKLTIKITHSNSDDVLGGEGYELEKYSILSLLSIERKPLRSSQSIFELKKDQ